VEQKKLRMQKGFRKQIKMQPEAQFFGHTVLRKKFSFSGRLYFDNFFLLTGV